MTAPLQYTENSRELNLSDTKYIAYKIRMGLDKFTRIGREI